MERRKRGKHQRLITVAAARRMRRCEELEGAVEWRSKSFPTWALLRVCYWQLYVERPGSNFPLYEYGVDLLTCDENHGESTMAKVAVHNFQGRGIRSNGHLWNPAPACKVSLLSSSWGLSWQSASTAQHRTAGTFTGFWVLTPSGSC